MIAIARREFSTHFVTLKGYVLLIATLGLFGFFFGLMLGQPREASMRDMFQLMEFLLLGICPILTMGLLSEEGRRGTLELLFTAPLSRTSVVAGKYLGALGFYGLVLLLSTQYWALLEFFADPPPMPILTGYAALLLEGCLFLAVGLLASSVAPSQSVAALTGYVALFGLYAVRLLPPYLPEATRATVTYLSVGTHTEGMFRGLVASNHLAYFATTTALFLGLTTLVMQTRES